jgi:hypothetical protein
MIKKTITMTAANAAFIAAALPTENGTAWTVGVNNLCEQYRCRLVDSLPNWSQDAWLHYAAVLKSQPQPALIGKQHPAVFMDATDQQVIAALWFIQIYNAKDWQGQDFDTIAAEIRRLMGAK